MPRISPTDNLVVEHPRDLVERKPKLLERENTIERGQLVGTVVAIAGRRIDMLGAEEPDAVVVAKQAGRHTRDPREIADPEHFRGPFC
jgi:hypothetical protein